MPGLGLLPVKILAVSPFAGTMVIAAMEGGGSPHRFVQYGALGICALAVVGLFAYLNKMTDIHRQERKELVASLQDEAEKREALANDCIRAMDRLSECLADRPCVASDQRVNLHTG